MLYSDKSLIKVQKHIYKIVSTIYLTYSILYFDFYSPIPVVLLAQSRSNHRCFGEHNISKEHLLHPRRPDLEESWGKMDNFKEIDYRVITIDPGFQSCNLEERHLLEEIDLSETKLV